jgi:hypothetical protein
MVAAVATHRLNELLWKGEKKEREKEGCEGKWNRGFLMKLNR